MNQILRIIVVLLRYRICHTHIARIMCTLDSGIDVNISSIVEFYIWWVLKRNIFGQESTYSKDFFFQIGR